jgi:hypothetical protein
MISVWLLTHISCISLCLRSVGENLSWSLRLRLRLRLWLSLSLSLTIAQISLVCIIKKIWYLLITKKILCHLSNIWQRALYISYHLISTTHLLFKSKKLLTNLISYIVD